MDRTRRVLSRLTRVGGTVQDKDPRTPSNVGHTRRRSVPLVAHGVTRGRDSQSGSVTVSTLESPTRVFLSTRDGRDLPPSLRRVSGSVLGSPPSTGISLLPTTTRVTGPQKSVEYSNSPVSDSLQTTPHRGEGGTYLFSTISSMGRESRKNPYSAPRGPRTHGLHGVMRYHVSRTRTPPSQIHQGSRRQTDR